jgi:hypothetical protein
MEILAEKKQEAAGIGGLVLVHPQQQHEMNEGANRAPPKSKN